MAKCKPGCGYNKCWKKLGSPFGKEYGRPTRGFNADTVRRVREAEAKRSSRSSSKGVAGSIIGTAMALFGASADLPQQSATPLRDEASTQARDERTRRTRTQRDATTGKGRGSSGSSGKR